MNISSTVLFHVQIHGLSPIMATVRCESPLDELARRSRLRRLMEVVDEVGAVRVELITGVDVKDNANADSGRTTILSNLPLNHHAGPREGSDASLTSVSLAWSAAKQG